jgi:hypothetical protein
MVRFENKIFSFTLKKLSGDVVATFEIVGLTPETSF